jgi:ABC-type Mn2+/Zn2+ transport systems, permease components
MIEEFLLSWNLFHNSYLAGWWMALLLSLIGVLVVARDQIFLSAAVSQGSTLGVAFGMWLGGVVVGEAWPWLRSERCSVRISDRICGNGGTGDGPRQASERGKH